MPGRRREPLWLTIDEIMALHDEQITLFGGGPGVLKRGALEAIAARPPQIYQHEPSSDLARFAAVYLTGLVNGHAFLDGNKRVGLAAMLVFLNRNGQPLHVAPLDLFDVVLGVATSRLRDDDATAWIRARLA